MRVALEDISSSVQSLSSLPVTAVNVPEGFTATIEPRTISITVDGPGAALSGMESSDVRVVVDVGGLEAGTHELTPQVFLPQGVTWTSTTPETIEVTIERSDDGTNPGNPLSTPEGTAVESSTGSLDEPMALVGRRPA